MVLQHPQAVLLALTWRFYRYTRDVPIILFFLPIILFRISAKMLLLFPRIAQLFPSKIKKVRRYSCDSTVVLWGFYNNIIVFEWRRSTLSSVKGKILVQQLQNSVGQAGQAWRPCSTEATAPHVLATSNEHQRKGPYRQQRPYSWEALH